MKLSPGEDDQRSLLILFIVQWEYYMGINAFIYSHSTMELNAWDPYYVLGTVPGLGHRVARTAGEKQSICPGKEDKTWLDHN